MTKKKLNIAIFSGELPSTTFIEHLIDGVSSIHRVSLFGIKKPSVTISYKGDVKVYVTPQNKFWNLYLSFYRSLRLLLKRPKDLILLWQEIKKYKTLYDRWIWFTKFLPIVLYRPDVLHLQWTRDLEFYIFFKTKFSIPIIVSFRGAHINYTPILEPRVANIYRNTFPKVDAFHAVSHAIISEASKYGNVSDRTHVIHSPIPDYFFKAFSEVTPTNTQKELNIASVGRHHWKKGFAYAVNAMSILKSKGLLVNYTIVGASQPNEELLFLINQLKLKETIKFKTGLPQKELIHFLKSQDVLLLTSVEEGIANVVLEAMAIGVPVVSTDCGGMSEVVRHKETGWLVPMRNSKAISEALLEMKKTNIKELNKITCASHNLVKEEFNYDNSIKEFIALYQNVVSQTSNKN